MDMKRILQAVDGVATKPVVGANDMAQFLRVVSEGDINQPAPIKVPEIPALPAQDGDQGDGTIVTDNGDGTKTFSTATGSFTYDAQGKAIKFRTPSISGLGQTIDLVTGNTENNYNQGPMSVQQKNDAKGNLISNRARVNLGPTSIQSKQYASGVKKLTAQGDGADAIVGVDASAKRLGVDPAKVQAQLAQAAPVSENNLSKFLSIIDKNDVSILNEGKNPHKVSLPVQMAMQHYQQQESIPASTRPRVIDRYFQQAEQEFTERKEEKRALMHQYASIIAERVLMKEAGESGWTRNGMAGVGLQSNAPEGGHLNLGETPIEMDPTAPNNPTVHGHQGANSMNLKGRIQQARAQLTELAELAQSDDLIVWEGICKKAKGGVFMGLEQNLEQIRHGIHELAAKRKRGGTASRGIDKHIG